MKKLILLVLALALITAPVSAAVIKGSQHDLSSGGVGTDALQATNTDQVCVFCHTPHQTTITTDPLWNHTLSEHSTYGVYDSTTFQGSGTIEEIGTTGTITNLCLSCHDGTVAVGSLYNPPGTTTPDNSAAKILSGNTAFVGVSLVDDHPVNFTYDGDLVTADNAAGGDLKAVPAASTGVVLFGGKVQCASCHDPHDSEFTPFLVATNAGSALCTTCHGQ